jgi:hypothetical protein
MQTALRASLVSLPPAQRARPRLADTERQTHNANVRCQPPPQSLTVKAHPPANTFKYVRNVACGVLSVVRAAGRRACPCWRR